MNFVEIFGLYSLFLRAQHLFLEFSKIKNAKLILNAFLLTLLRLTSSSKVAHSIVFWFSQNTKLVLDFGKRAPSQVAHVPNASGEFVPRLLHHTAPVPPKISML